MESRAIPAPGDSGSNVWAVVLAGGAGKRLQGFIHQVLHSERPKQFCRIVGTRSMLRHTWDRAARVVGSSRIVTVITAGQEPYVWEEARDGVPGTVLVQPANKETAPGVLLPLLWIARRDPDAIAVVFPADHFIWEEDRFGGHVRAALAAAPAWPERLVVLGVEADGPEVEYGWIAPGEPFAAGRATELYGVRRFWEKPDRPTAARLFACGYFWNTLVLAGRVASFVGLAAASIPRVLELLQAGAAGLDAPARAFALERAYDRIPPTNLSQAVLARCPEGLLVLAARDVAWSDWGDEDRIVRTLRRFQRRPEWLAAYLARQAATVA
jgi:mannose-1-phosphate guanylyltransferase